MAIFIGGRLATSQSFGQWLQFERGDSMADSPLAGRHALITGGGTGIGAAAAAHLNTAGAKLSLLGRRIEPLQAVAESYGGSAIRCDVTDPARIAAAFDEARAANGPIDLLVVNAGIAESAPFHKMTREGWDRIVGTNLTAAFECSRAAIGDLLKSDNGRLVFVASVASLRGVPYAAHYAASKHGLLGLTRSLAAEYAKTNLTVNAVCPGYVDTPMTDQSVARVSEITGRSEEDSRGAITNMNASGRLVDPDGIGTMILTLCLPQSRDVNGAAITLDGGTSA
jgi:NAD(P)-dependent dehydrogenase (short-subunit alcohol dehydrogenase family)